MKRPWRLESRSGGSEWRIVATYSTEERAEASRAIYEGWYGMSKPQYRVVKHVDFEAES